MANPQEVQRARTAFGEWFPRHGALQTRKNDLYVAMHAALQAGQIDRHNLVSLGNGLKTALAQRKREEVKTVVETAEAIHNAHNFKAALAYLRGELNLGQPTAQQPQPPAKPSPSNRRKVLTQMFRLGGSEHLLYKKTKPSQVIAGVRKALGPIELERASSLSFKHSKLLMLTSFLALAFYGMMLRHLAISQKTRLGMDKVEKALLPIYDVAFEKIKPKAHEDILQVIEAMTKGEFDKKSFEKTVAIYSAAVNSVASAYTKKKSKNKWELPPDLFGDVSQELLPLGERKPAPITVARLEQVLKKHVDAYAAEKT